MRRFFDVILTADVSLVPLSLRFDEEIGALPKPVVGGDDAFWKHLRALQSVQVDLLYS